MSLRNQFWVLRQNYAEITHQTDVKNLIKSQQFVTCPWGGWGTPRQNVIDNIYNETLRDESDRTSSGQPFAKNNGYIVARITSDVEYAINTGLNWKKKGKKINIGNNDGLPFRPVGRYIEIISEDFIPSNKSLGQWTLSKINNKELLSELNDL